MMRDLLMDDRLKGQAAGIFFIGYVLLQIPGGSWRTIGARENSSACASFFGAHARSVAG